jgi:4-amino-4-deoxy-L-arabinose transferase-like glycosyltransferase
MDTAVLQNLRRRLWSPAGLAYLALALIWVAAVVFRLSDLAARDLWTDEAWVAVAALKSTPGAALAAGQSTPPFYMLTVWAVAQLLSSQEWALRSLSCAFGLGTLLIFWLLLRRLTTRPVALLALALVACSPVMVYYSKELKQYSGDAFFAVLIFLLVEWLRQRESKWLWPALGLAGILSLGFSHALVFILPLAWAALWFILPARRLKVALLGGVWAAAFAAGYFLFLRGQVDPELVAYWAQDFPNFSSLAAFLWWLGTAFYRYFRYFFGEWGLFWGPPLLLAGVLVLVRQGRTRACFYLGGPLLLTLGAAAMHRYPFMAHYGGNRLMLFSAPLLYLVAAVGLMAVLTWLWEKRQRVLALALTGLLLLALNPRDLIRENLYPEHNREEIQPLVAYLQSRLQPQDWVYVYYFAVSPFKYYFHRPGQKVCWGNSCGETNLMMPAAASQHPRRLWLIASHFPSLEGMRKFARDLLGPQWRETACLSRVSAALLCFEWQGQQLAKSPASPVRPGESGLPVPPAGTAYR